jgi:plastocyanin
MSTAQPKSYLPGLLLLVLSAVPLCSFGQSGGNAGGQNGQATSWNAAVGAQRLDCLVGGASDDKLAAGCEAQQAIAFLPNEMWIHAGDSITWTQTTEESHTVTFLYQPQPLPLGTAPYPAAQQRQSNATGCMAYGSVVSPDNSAYDPSGTHGLKCVHSGPLPSYGSTFTVKFPAQGNFKFTCLIHNSMFGTVHVLDPAAALLFGQAAYDKLADEQVNNLTGDLIAEGLSKYGANPRVFMVGKILGTGGGWQYGSLFRFVDAKGHVLTKTSPLLIHAGQTVEFTDIDPAEPHTITFGCPSDDPTCPTFVGPLALVNVNDTGPQPKGTAVDGANFAVMNPPFHPADEGDRSMGNQSEINSGLIIPQAQDRATGISPLSGTPGTSVPIAQVSPSLTRFRVTFNALGQYRFICELHDQLGMIGWVNVVE